MAKSRHPVGYLCRRSRFAVAALLGKIMELLQRGDGVVPITEYGRRA
jgi:hypothetical protein